MTTTPCSLQSRAVDESLAGTAPVALAWVIVEHPGPWGRDALREADLPETVRAVLLEAKARGIGVLLARHPDRSDRTSQAGVHVWVARTAPGGARLRHAVLDSLDPLARWNLDELAAGVLPPIGTGVNRALTLVCTHSRRDQCCAVNGRALMAGLLDRQPPELRSDIWECSHVGGHRFAPVVLSLPSGTVHGRLSVDEAIDVVERHDDRRVLPDRMRGRSCFPEPLQSADVAVRRSADVDGCDDLDVLVVREGRATPVGLGWAVPTGGVDLEVRHRDGRAWRVHVQHVSYPTVRSESCEGELVPVHSWVASEVVEVADWT